MQFRDNLSGAACRHGTIAGTLPSPSGDDMIQPIKTIFRTAKLMEEK
jgi:hypothetical protein